MDQPSNGRVTQHELREEIRELRAEVKADISALRTELAPAITFYQRASGVLGVIKWAGPTALLVALSALLAWATSPH